MCVTNLLSKLPTSLPSFTEIGLLQYGIVKVFFWHAMVKGD